MSYTSTISHYIKIASQGRELDAGNMVELEEAIDALIDSAVREAVRRARDERLTAVPPELEGYVAPPLTKDNGQ